jgi:hypothetical protein
MYLCKKDKCKLRLDKRMQRLSCDDFRGYSTDDAAAMLLGPYPGIVLSVDGCDK